MNAPGFRESPQVLANIAGQTVESVDKASMAGRHLSG
jgi:hypothetical protein